ncbi:MAG: hypothetical protein GF350_02850 [Chitinivibrionales bacterium]|nr:hypothetical protein [Chitinivibrionales bacterium]
MAVSEKEVYRIAVQEQYRLLQKQAEILKEQVSSGSNKAAGAKAIKRIERAIEKGKREIELLDDSADDSSWTALKEKVEAGIKKIPRFFDEAAREIKQRKKVNSPA